MNLSPVQQKFILHWGEMGTRWGINRTVAQIHALLYLTAEPLNAEQITETLGVARSNVSNSLRELQQWGIVRTVHKLGDRRDHFESLQDVWEMFQVIMDERKKREIDPTIALLEQCVKESAGENEHTQQQLLKLHDFFDAASAWYANMRRLPTNGLSKFFRMGKKIRTHVTRKVPLLLVVGGREAEEGTVTIRRYGIKEQRSMAVDEFMSMLRSEIAERRHVTEW